ncbi:hypothetical protein IE53DRAFT_410971 [Violaceomyces palustris]|uniref:Uncharacterized protein n=1 Tax=Violaceomyces palustris TaxID=1673888 RepID=A0ACD0NX19_9BASI|nr:hypothetical protein IE53DRAFT_410971 [Violaceomyces palustris]
MSLRAWRCRYPSSPYLGRFLRLQSLQLILRLQILSLKRFWPQLPEQIEAIARDLWALLVSTLPSFHFPAEPFVATCRSYEARTGEKIEIEATLQEDGLLHPGLYEQFKKRRESDAAIKRTRRRLKRERGSSDDEARTQGAQRGRLNKGELETETEAEAEDEEENEDDDEEDGGFDTEAQLEELDPELARIRKEERKERKRKRSIRRKQREEELKRRKMEKEEKERTSESKEDPRGGDEDREKRTRLDGSEIGPEDEGLSKMDPSSGSSGSESDLSSVSSSEDDDSSSENSGDRKRESKKEILRNKVSKRIQLTGWAASLRSTVSILYLALVHCRVPVCWIDLIEMISSFQLPYLNALHYLPRDLIKPLCALDIRYGELDPSCVPSMKEFHNHTYRVIDVLHRDFGITFPEINGPPMIWRMVESLGLPPTFYVACKSLLTFLGLSLHLHPSAVPEELFGDEVGDDDDDDGEGEVVAGQPQGSGDSRKANQTGGRSTGLVVAQKLPREMIVVSALIICSKMRWGLDDEVRYESIKGPISCSPSLSKLLKAWSQLKSELRDHPVSVHETGMGGRSKTALEMGEKELDQYLDFVEACLPLKNEPLIYHWRKDFKVGGGGGLLDSLTRDDKDEVGTRSVFDLQDLTRGPVQPEGSSERRGTDSSRRQVIREMIREKLAKLYEKPLASVPISDQLVRGEEEEEGERLRTGQAYRSFLGGDVGGGLVPREMKVFLGHCCHILGLEVETPFSDEEEEEGGDRILRGGLEELEKCVELLERRIVACLRRRRKEARLRARAGFERRGETRGLEGDDERAEEEVEEGEDEFDEEG